MNSNIAKSQSATSAGRGFWWHPHFSDVAGQAASCEVTGGFWWHPHFSPAGENIDV